jgi:anthranilate phosphoribosyltransferase
MILKSSIEKLMRGENLKSNAVTQILDELLNPAVNPLQVAAFLVLLRAKKETADELSAIVTLLREKMIVVPIDHTVLDIVGTGGDGFNSVNISTGSALLAASCGVKVAKHGNSSVSSLAGSADVLQALGVNIKLTPEQISKSIAQIGIGFCYSPNFHPTTKALRHFRKALNVPTTFNMLGPLLNPAKATHVILGVHDVALLPIMADVLIHIENDRSVVVHSMGLDEISCVGPTKVMEIRRKEKFEYTIDPLDFGLPRCSITDLQGGTASENAQLLLATFKGRGGPIADTLILNAAVALYIYGFYSSIKDAIAHASNNLYSGAVLTLLNNWIEFSHEK